ncbi:MAG: hypothetical protein K6F06_02535 [Bacteroidales bacterium]|nr:hypothetical protein [Bacteroidales bacterium]
MLSAIVVVLLLGAFLGFIFSKKGKESEGAVGGAKKAGCLLVVFAFLAVIAIILIALML